MSHTLVRVLSWMCAQASELRRRSIAPILAWVGVRQCNWRPVRWLLSRLSWRLFSRQWMCKRQRLLLQPNSRPDVSSTALKGREKDHGDEYPNEHAITTAD